jgi:hypothetical protein
MCLAVRSGRETTSWRGGGWGLGSSGLELGLAATAIGAAIAGGYPDDVYGYPGYGDMRSAPTLAVASHDGAHQALGVGCGVASGSATRHYLVRNGVERRLRRAW